MQATKKRIVIRDYARNIRWSALKELEKAGFVVVSVVVLREQDEKETQ